MRSYKLLFIVILNITHLLARAEDVVTSGRSIKTQAPFLLIPTDARGSAMGEIGAATEPDAYSYYWNPAKLAFVENKFSLAVSYIPWLRELGVADVSLNSVDAYYKIDDQQSTALSFTYFSLGEIQYTNQNGDNVNVFSPNELSLGLSYSRKFTKTFSLALNAKYLYSNLAGEISGNSGPFTGVETRPASAFAADVGAYYVTNYELFSRKFKNTYGLSMSNLGNKISYTDNKRAAMPIPTNLRFGTTFKTDIDDISTISFSIEAVKLMVPSPAATPGEQKDFTVIEGMLNSFSDAPGGGSEEWDEVTPSFGAEYKYKESLAIRAGFMKEHETKGARQYITLGLGLVYNSFNFDLSYYKPTSAIDNPFNNQLKVSVTFRFTERTDGNIPDSISF